MKKHMKHVFTMLNYLNEKNLKFKLKKCEFHKIEMRFLEFIINQNEIRID